MIHDLMYIELKTGYSDDGPAWIGYVKTSKSKKTIYFNNHAFQKYNGNYSNYIDIENGELLISRKITPTRSQIKVNGQNFTAAQTQKLARYLIDVHGQHDNQILMDDANHLTVVDTFCADEIAELREAMEDAYKDMVKANKALELIDKDKDELQKEIE